MHPFIDKWLGRRYGERLIDAHLKGDLGRQFNDVTDYEVWRVIFVERWKATIAPLNRWLQRLTSLLTTPWRLLNGRYRTSTPTIQGGTTPAPSASPGPGITLANPTPGFATNPVGPGGTFEDAGIRAGEVVAYRCWVLRDGLLYSAYRDQFVWTPGKVVEGAPQYAAQGVHAFKYRYDACAYVAVYEDSKISIVSGTVELWGDVYEHERGYRASHAYPASFDDSPHYDAAKLRKLYGLNRKNKISASRPQPAATAASRRPPDSAAAGPE